MKLATLGASGSVGREIVTQALAAGRDVTVFVRDTPRPGLFDPRVTAVQGGAGDRDCEDHDQVGREGPNQI